MIRVFVGLIFFSTLAWSQEGDYEQSLYRSMMNAELKGWSNQETGTTTKLENQCGVLTEYHLVGDHQKNGVVVGVSNNGDDTIILRNSDPEKNQKILPGTWAISSIPFPSKDELGEMKEVLVNFTVDNETTKEPCTITTKFTRSQHLLKEDVSYTLLEMSLDGGPAWQQWGNVRRLGKPNTSLFLSFNKFINPNQGFGLSLGGHASFKDSKNLKVQESFKNRAAYEANMTSVTFNYTHRYFINRKFHVQYGPGLGIQFINDPNGEVGRMNKAADLLFHQKLMFHWNMAKLLELSDQYVVFFAGIGLSHSYAPKVSIRDTDLSGHRLSALARLGFGI